MLGKRDTEHYGSVTLPEIESRLRDKAETLGLDVDFFQSNHEGAIVDYVQESAEGASAIIINPGALTHYGLSMRDALVDSRLPIVEVHLSNVHGRERFRRRSVVSTIAVGQIAGLGWRGYLYGLEFLAAYLSSEVG